MVNGQHVVVLDGLHETEEVLKAVLEPRGCRVNRIRKPQPGHLIAEQDLPSIVVMHDDDSANSSHAQPGWDEIPKVVIGSVKVPATDQAEQSTRFLMQPFQYAELIDSIESLLNQPRSLQ
ncbi:hypothetical protein Pan153_11140 [Gimesia panareensis]|uniref:Uncharacterized protein n=1 Tax=Gimesia panareensis TaxID=2527978 RepID=A0A518FJF2_9PLAN|nr:hypothetical protein [Gimesia panareensis]QDV16485.1 hypothetical protein Pan153_11140 [Gimesia panareensis]